MKPRKILVATLAIAALAIGEASHWWASSRQPRRQAKPTDHLGLIVLGYPSLGSGKPSSIQRWRCEIALREVERHPGPTTVVFSGWAGRAATSEAHAMAAVALSMGMDESIIIEEDQASTTWENIEFSVPFVRDCEAIAIVSNPHHAHRGRAYLAQQFPDLEQKLVRVDDYRFGAHFWDKLRFGFFETALAIKYRWFADEPPMSRRDRSKDASTA